MRNLTSFLLIFLLSFIQLHAQESNTWTIENKPLLFEKLYLHVDRELYAPGDMIWMKAYQVNGITHELNSNYRNVFVQLVNDSGRVVKDALLFSIKGQATGSFKTDSLKSGRYTIRAFTRYLENFGEEALFHRNIILSDAKEPFQVKTDTIDYSTIEVAFLPEGGNLVLNATNTVAFKAISKKGKGIPVSGKIIDDQGDTIVSFKTIYRGMGRFTFMPVEKRIYYAVIDQNSKVKIKLPDALMDGVNLSCKDLGESICFTLSVNGNQDKEYSFYLKVSRKGTTLTRYVEMYDNTQTLCLGKELFPPGISKVTVLDALKNPVAERLVFVENEESDILSFQLNKQAYGPREKVVMDINSFLSEGDSITSSLSLNVVNDAYFGADGNSQDIRSYLLLDAELKGSIEAPASYFTDDKIPSSQKLDLLMMVNGWRSYIWDEVANTNNLDTIDWNDAGIEIKGYVKKLLWNAPLADAELKLGYVFRNYTIGNAVSDKNGRFSFDKTFFYDSTQVMINGRTKQGNRNMEIMLDPQFSLSRRVSSLQLIKETSAINLTRDFYLDNVTRREKELAFNLEKGTILLKGVDIVKKKSTPFSRSMGDYPWADKTLTVEPKDYSYMYIIDYLEAKIPALVRADNSWKLGNYPFYFMLDNMGSDLGELTTVRMKDIEFIDIVMPHWNAFKFGSLGETSKVGIIAIYRKEIHQVPIDYNQVKGRIRPAIRGYHRTPKFYSPTYTSENINDSKPDYRPTLLWEPELTFKDGKANIEFYTSDELAHYVVFVEGITKNGKICYGTTNFVVDKK